ncbi:MAG: DUF6387 family protein [Proteobacteria bacterium]|nr:DUF6387 family protein [Pseudomonadota bacterium]
MAKKITDFAELPHWFRNANYLQAQSFSAIDWFFHLEARFQVMEWDREIKILVHDLESGQNPNREVVY